MSILKTAFGGKNISVKDIYAALGIVFLTFMVYLPALDNDFVNWDDNAYVYENINIRSIDYNFVKWSFTNAKVGHWCPLTWLSFATDYAMWGMNPWGYHLTNIILHSLNALLVFILTLKLINVDYFKKSIKNDNNALITGITTSILFSIHPLHVESVAWITERKDVLSLFFFLICLLSYIRYISTEGLKRVIYYCISLALFIMSLLTKPMAISLPIILLVLDFYPFKRLGVGVDLKKSKWIIIEKFPFFILSILSAMMTIWAARSVGAMQETQALPFIFRAIMVGRNYLFYLYKMIIPFNLAPFYPFPLIAEVYSLEYIGSSVLFLLITFFCMMSGRIFIAVWLYYVVALIPVIGIIQAGSQVAADRYTYLPGLGPFLLAGLGISALFNKYSTKQHRLMIIAALTVLSVVFANRTVQQIKIWHDSIALWSHEIKLFPELEKAYQNRGAAYGHKGEHRQALKDFSRAIELNPGRAEGHSNRGTIYISIGNYQQAIIDYSKALELDPRSYKASYERGFAYSKIGNYLAAITDYSNAINLNPKDIRTYNSRGNAYRYLNQYQLSLQDFNKAIQLDPEDPIVFNNRGVIYGKLGYIDRELADYERAVKLNPKYAEAYFNLGRVYSQAGNDSLAFSNFNKAYSLGLKEAKEYLKKEHLPK